MDTLEFKVLAVVLLAISGLIGGLVPLRIELSKTGKRLLMLGNALAGGIFLGAGLIHMLGDAVDLFETISGDSDYPWALFVCGCGFLAILMLERVCAGREESDVSADGRSIYPYVLLLVLSVHSVIAGVSLGLERDMAATVVLFIALIAHKGAAAFALGVGLRNSGTEVATHKKLVAFFSSMTPLGCCLGTVFARSATGDTIDHFEAVFDALAAGTFLYVAILDIIAESFESRRDRLKKFLLVFAGFGLMALVAIWT